MLFDLKCAILIQISEHLKVKSLNTILLSAKWVRRNLIQVGLAKEVKQKRLRRIIWLAVTS